MLKNMLEPRCFMAKEQAVAKKVKTTMAEVASDYRAQREAQELMNEWINRAQRRKR